MITLPEGNLITSPFLDGFPVHKTKTFLEGAATINLSNNKQIFSQGEIANHFGLVISGCIKVIKESPQKDTLLDIISKDQLFGVLLMSNHTTQYPANVISNGQSKVALIPRETYLKYWITEPELILKVQENVRNRCHDFHSDRALQNMPVLTRIAGYIFRLLEFDPITLHYKTKSRLTHRELSMAIGAEIETIIRAIKTLEKKSLLIRKDGVIYVPNIDQLVDFARK